VQSLHEHGCCIFGLSRFYNSQQSIEGIDIWHQHQVFVDAAAKNYTSNTNAERSLGNLRHLISQEKKEQIIEFKKHQKELQVPQTAAMQVTLIIKVTFSFIPQELRAKLAVVTIQKNESEFIAMLQDQSAFYTYFKPLDGISCNVVHDLTIPPTSQPTTHAHFLASQQKISLNDDCGLEFGAVSIADGFF
jgi:hypothetical protein